jgi:flagellar assembly protein FliH
MLDLSVHLAEKIVSEAATNMPEVVKANVDKCINLLAGSGEVVVKINPADYEIVKAYLPSLEHKFEGKFSFSLKPDQNMTSGGCLIEMNGSVIDGRIETQLAKIKQQMMLLS